MARRRSARPPTRRRSSVAAPAGMATSAVALRSPAARLGYRRRGHSRGLPPHSKPHPATETKRRVPDERRAIASSRKTVGLTLIRRIYYRSRGRGRCGIYMAPHSGSEMRRRLALGAKTAQEELSEVVEETCVALEALAKDARQTLRQTAWRLTEVVTATKDAFQAEADALERMSADE